MFFTSVCAFCAVQEVTIMSGQKRMQWKEEDMVAALGAVNTDSLTSGIFLQCPAKDPR